jgi:uncharacterized membrane protein (DUF4010 family)
LEKLGLSLLLGLLVGLQRERTDSWLAGMRTFPLITMLGTVCAILAGWFGGWIVAAGFLGASALAVVGNLSQARSVSPSSGPAAELALNKAESHSIHSGTTTEFAILLMYAVGAYLVEGSWVVASAIGGGVAVLLQFKGELHGFARRLSDDDLRAIMRFVLITFIVLPALPNETIGPLDVFNPHEAWLMVVLIVGISLGGYIIYKFFGTDAGVVLGGILGGAISSTATMVSYARRAAADGAGATLSSVVLLIATTTVYFRVLTEIAVVAPGFLSMAAPPLFFMAALAGLPVLLYWLVARRQGHAMPEQDNPTQLRVAILFGLLYTAVLFALAAAKEYIQGEGGLYAVAALAGLTDMNAITLSTSRMVVAERIAADQGWKLLVAAAMSNLVFNAVIVGVLGNRRLLVRVAALSLLPLAGGAALLWWGERIW